MNNNTKVPGLLDAIGDPDFAAKSDERKRILDAISRQMGSYDEARDALYYFEHVQTAEGQTIN
jgi:hypothetical protein